VSFRNFLHAFSSRSLATRLFFSGQPQPLERAANGRPTRSDLPLRRERALQFFQRHIRLLLDGVPEQRQLGRVQPSDRTAAVARGQVLPRPM
jgi:hypothetical protein